MTNAESSFKLVLKTEIYPVIFVIWGGDNNFDDFVKCMVNEGAVEKKVRKQVGDMYKCKNTAGFRVDQGIVQGIFV